MGLLSLLLRYMQGDFVHYPPHTHPNLTKYINLQSRVFDAFLHLLRRVMEVFEPSLPYIHMEMPFDFAKFFNSTKAFGYTKIF